MAIGTYLAFAFVLLLFSYIVFRMLVRRDYRNHARLRPLASVAQLLVFFALMCFPYLFNPPEWPWFWRLPGSASLAIQRIGIGLICFGFIVSFGTMGWFGMGKAFGLNITGLTKQGPYRFSRNPQILGGYLLVIGTAIQWHSIHSYGWIFFYALITHWMVITEEEHLRRVFGDEYEAYCLKVPRYLLPLRCKVGNSRSGSKSGG
jgi:protein-S-isoprenylcysteine O-methyltransferase Ste14